MNLPVVTPESIGIPSEALLRFYDEIRARQIPMHSFMLLRHGKIATQGWWAPHHESEKHIIYSVSKVFTAMAVGFCIEEGRFSLQDRIADFFPEKIDQPLHPWCTEKTVENLLTMRSGHPHATDRTTGDWVKPFLNTVPPIRPGTLFGYDSTATHALCALVQKVTGLTMMAYLKPRLFDPLGITDIYCQQDPMGIDTGSRGIHARTLDMAKFGQLMLQKGEWDGKQIIPRAWVEACTKKQVNNAVSPGKNEAFYGYGYKFWMLRGNAYAGIGSGGQLIAVFPDEDLVFASTANILDGEGDYYLILRLFWACIYPYLSNKALPDNAIKAKELSQTTEALTMLMPYGKTDSPRFARLDKETYCFEKPGKCDLRTVSFAVENDNLRVNLRLGEEDFSILAGRGYWAPQYLRYPDDDGWSQYVFVDDDTLFVFVHLALKLGTYKLHFNFRDDDMSCIIRPVGWTDYKRLDYIGCGKRNQ